MQKVPLIGYANDWTNDYWGTKYVVLGVDNIKMRGPLKKMPKIVKNKVPNFQAPKPVKITPQQQKLIKATFGKHAKAFHRGKKKEEQFFTIALTKAAIKELEGKGLTKMQIAAGDPRLSNYIHSQKKYEPIPKELAGDQWVVSSHQADFKEPPNSSVVLFVKPKDNKASQLSAATKIIERFASRAFRRPVTKDELKGLVSIYEKDRKRGKEYLESLKLSLTAVLVSPKFLYRLEKKRTGEKYYKLNDYELASRLSFFLWMSIPDDELTKLAAKGELSKPGVMEKQVMRMIKDKKSESFTGQFITQWLGVYKIGKEVQPDPKTFKGFEQLKPLMIKELKMYFSGMVRENRNAFEIIDSDYTYVNDKLAKHYRLRGVRGSEFKKVKIKNKTRGGVLGMAAVLTASTAHPTRTSPVDRGKWVLEELLGEKLPDPPADVPPLDEKAGKEGQKLTFRQSLEKHQEDEGCAVCHRKIDPIGFGLENFDSIGRFRTKIGGKPIDSVGILPSGEKFKNVQELKAILMKKEDKFSRNIVEKMLSFALGRKLKFYDEPAVMEITKKFKASDYKIQSLIVAIVKSKPFLYQNNHREMKSEK